MDRIYPEEDTPYKNVHKSDESTYHKVKMALVVIERGVMSRKHPAFEYCVGGARGGSVHIASNLKHELHFVKARIPEKWQP